MRALTRNLVTVNIFLAILVVGFSIPAGAQTGDPVARVIRISDGGRLDYSRQEGRWYQAYLEMKDYVNDKLRTDANSYGSIEFYTGGQVGLNKNTLIEITSESNANVLNLTGGGVWGKFSKQKEKPIEVRTSSGVMGIRGTEFVITEKDGGTEVSVLEGQVIATPVDGDPIEVNPGMTVLLKLRAVPVVNQQRPEELRKELLNSPDWSGFNHSLRWARRINQYTPGRGFSRELYWTGRSLSVVQNPERELGNEAERQLDRGLRRATGGFGLPVRIGIGDRASKNKQAQKVETDFPLNLSPDHQNEPGTPLSSTNFDLSWDALRGADHYFVMIGRDDAMEDLAWTHETSSKTTSVRYPSSARPLDSGQYYWRVIGVDRKGEPVGRASQTYFFVIDR